MFWWLMKKLIFIALTVTSCTSLFGQAPGNVSANLIWWLKANSGVSESDGTTAEDGDGVDNWDDISAGDNDAETGEGSAATRPLYRTGIINGNPALEFDGTKFLDAQAVSGIGTTQSFYFFLVFKQTSFFPGGVSDGAGTFIMDRRDATNNLTSFKVVNTDKYFYQRRQDDGNNLGGPVSVTAVNTSSFVIADYFRNWVSAASATEGIYLNGNLDISQAGPTGNMAGPLLKIGNHADHIDNTDGLHGYFAEIVGYNANLTAAERQRVESYLAIKYGITLDPAMNYVRSDGTVIYPSTGTHSAYVSDIAGIGRDDNSALNQTSSRSQNASYMVTISGASSLGNNDFLVWGHNNGSLTAPNSSDVGGTILRRLSRVWRVEEANDVGTFTLSIDLSAVPGPKAAANLRLLVDTNGTFATGATAYSVNSSAGSVYTFTGVSITDDDFFTIGSTNTTTTPLPVELTDFDVTYESPAVVATWKTASELNNDYFTLERAGEDLSFDEIAHQPGAGTTKEPRSYSAIDPNPYDGKSYYRLKQTDYDGTFSYSDTKYIFIEGKGNKLSVFPNPNEGRLLNFKLSNSLFHLQQVEIMDQQGKTLERLSVKETNLREYPIELKQRLPAGVYVMRVNYNGKEEHLKLVVR